MRGFEDLRLKPLKHTQKADIKFEGREYEANLASGLIIFFAFNLNVFSSGFHSLVCLFVQRVISFSKQMRQNYVKLKRF